MAHNNEMTQKMRQALSNIAPFEERMMFGALGFMINGKLAICVGKDDVMYKIGPELTRAKLDSREAEPVTMGNRTMRGWVVVENGRLENAKDFNEWVAAAVDYNLSNA